MKFTVIHEEADVVSAGIDKTIALRTVVLQGPAGTLKLNDPDHIYVLGHIYEVSIREVTQP